MKQEEESEEGKREGDGDESGRAGTAHGVEVGLALCQCCLTQNKRPN